MALFDASLLFSHTGNLYNFTSGEFVSLVGTTVSSASGVVNLGNARDLGIGPGAEIPTVVVATGVGITTSSTSTTVNVQFQGSTDSVNWTTYIETGADASSSFLAGSTFIFPVPRRPPGAALPLYYRLNYAVVAAGAGVSTGTVLAGIVLAAAENAGTMALYPSGFSVS